MGPWCAETCPKSELLYVVEINPPMFVTTIKIGSYPWFPGEFRFHGEAQDAKEISSAPMLFFWDRGCSWQHWPSSYSKLSLPSSVSLPPTLSVSMCYCAHLSTAGRLDLLIWFWMISWDCTIIWQKYDYKVPFKLPKELLVGIVLK
jgi:hypothetical protein